MDFNIQEWAKNFEISDETLSALDKKGFNSKRSIKKLTKDIIKTEFKALKTAQMLLLEDAVESLQEKPPPPPSHSTERSDARGDGMQQTLDAGGSLSVDDVLRSLGKSTRTPEAQDKDAGKPALFDPLAFTFDQKMGGTSTKFRDIRDFITVCTKDRRDSDGSEGTVKVGQIELSLRDSKVPLEKINLAQYMEGSLRI